MGHKLGRGWYVALALWMTMLLPSLAWAARGLPDFTDLVEAVSPAVVNISTTQQGFPYGLQVPELPPDHPLRDFLDRFGGGMPQGPGEGFDAQSLGSGFVISKDGYILTNYHVVRDADEIIVTFSDRREFVAEVIGYDDRSDLALLKIEAKNLPVVNLGRSADLKVGEWVLAIGTPFGFDHSATAGIVSAKGRSLPTENYVPFIQTDVAINPGNSGGPLFNLDGEVVGVNSQIYSRTGGFMGLSFAIPIELAMDVADQLRESGRVSRGWLGVLIQDVTRDLAESFGMDKPYGALVAEVMPESPAAQAGLRVGDIIVEFDGKEVGTSGMLPPMVGRARVGESVPVRVIREGEPQMLQIRIEELPDDAESRVGDVAPQAPEPGVENARLGVTVEELDQDQREMFNVPEGGVLVTEVAQGPAQAADIRRGDVLLMLDQQRINSVEEFRSVAEALPAGKSVPVLVQREGAPRFLAMRLPED